MNILDYKIKDIELAEEGELLIEWASDHMPVLGLIKERFAKERPLQGVKLGAVLHCTKETAVLIRTLEAGGAKVALAGSNPLSTQDAVVASLAKKGTNVYSWRGQSAQEYYWCVDQVVKKRPVITMDDGCDLVSRIHSHYPEGLNDIKAGSEETTTGVIRLKAMHESRALKYPMVAVNDTPTKRIFDNRYGTGQSTIDGILRASSVMIAGKKFVVCGYGWCSRGIAMRAKGMGANVIITEVDPLKALEAAMEGYRVMPLIEAAPEGDIFVTSTGNVNVIDLCHIKEMKNGAMLANSGHFNVEININALEKLATSKKRMRPDLDQYTLKDGRKIYLLGEGRLVNLAAAEGHPSSVMDMSFANQALVAEWLWNSPKLDIGVHDVPSKIDNQIARLKLDSMEIKIDELTKEQEKYLKSWKEGTL
jgi:adenosylhomocysteinase